MYKHIKPLWFSYIMNYSINFICSNTGFYSLSSNIKYFTPQLNYKLASNQFISYSTCCSHSFYLFAVQLFNTTRGLCCPFRIWNAFLRIIRPFNMSWYCSYFRLNKITVMTILLLLPFIKKKLKLNLQ